MVEGLDVASLERKAWKSFHQDGLKDMFLGLILLAVGVSEMLGSSLMLLGLEAAAIIGLIVCKRYITARRLGRVEFSPARKARKKKAILVVGLAALLGLGAYLTVAGFAGASDWLASHRGLVYAGVGVWLFLLMAMMAYWLDFTRLYWIALVIGAAFSTAFWLKEPLVFVIAGIVVTVPGLVLFVRFLHRYPSEPVIQPAGSR